MYICIIYVDLLCNDVIDNITLMTSQFYVRILMVHQNDIKKEKKKQKLKKTFNRSWENLLSI